jgi:hypothetical protein
LARMGFSPSPSHDQSRNCRCSHLSVVTKNLEIFGGSIVSAFCRSLRVDFQDRSLIHSRFSPTIAHHEGKSTACLYFVRACRSSSRCCHLPRPDLKRLDQVRREHYSIRLDELLYREQYRRCAWKFARSVLLVGSWCYVGSVLQQ